MTGEAPPVAGSMHDLALQLAETRGELRELILEIRSEIRDHDRRLTAVEQEQAAAWRRVDEQRDRIEAVAMNEVTGRTDVRATRRTVLAGTAVLGALAGAMTAAATIASVAL